MGVARFGGGVTTGRAALGRALLRAAPDLARVWRLARRQSRPRVFPGLLDGVVRGFLEAAGRALAGGDAPEQAWAATAGMVRLGPAGAEDELTAEWALLMEVLAAACESYRADPEVGEWLARAVAAGERATATLSAGAKAPPAVLVVRVAPSGPDADGGVAEDDPS